MNDDEKTGRKPGRFLDILGPGLLVAATGVGAGDLATASFTGNQLGVGILWAVLLGALLKFVLNEGLARWQLATGATLLEGCAKHLGFIFQVAFFAYLLFWSFFVGSALMAACGATMHAIVPVFADPAEGKFWFGIAHSFLGVLLVWWGGYRLFARVMSGCIGVMFITVIVTAVRIGPDWSAVAAGLVLPRIPQFREGGVIWTIALMGGVGGSLTVLCYGYWIREEGRTGTDALRVTRLDLAVGYMMTALFGMSMVIIGSRTTVSGSGAGLIVALSENLNEALGPAGRWLFLAGAWGAVFSSLLGVWQSVPYIFADACGLFFKDTPEARAVRVATSSWWYKIYLLALAVVPILALRYGFRDLQKLYAVVGAGFMPFLAVVLLLLNGRSKWIGAEYRNRTLTNVLLVFLVLVFLIVGWLEAFPGLGG